MYPDLLTVFVILFAAFIVVLLGGIIGFIGMGLAHLIEIIYLIIFIMLIVYCIKQYRGMRKRTLLSIVAAAFHLFGLMIMMFSYGKVFLVFIKEFDPTMELTLELVFAAPIVFAVGIFVLCIIGYIEATWLEKLDEFKTMKITYAVIYFVFALIISFGIQLPLYW